MEKSIEIYDEVQRKTVTFKNTKISLLSEIWYYGILNRTACPYCDSFRTTKSSCRGGRYYEGIKKTIYDWNSFDCHSCGQTFSTTINLPKNLK